jgi:hypothetical protein
LAEGDASVYNAFKHALLHGDCKLTSDTIKVALLGSGYTYSQDLASGFQSINSYEITSTGYTAGGCDIASPTAVVVNSQDIARFDAADLTWANLGTDVIRHAVMWDDTVTATFAGAIADVCMIHWEIATNSNGGNYTLQFGSSGILELG